MIWKVWKKKILKKFWKKEIKIGKIFRERFREKVQSLTLLRKFSMVSVKGPFYTSQWKKPPRQSGTRLATSPRTARRRPRARPASLEESVDSVVVPSDARQRNARQSTWSVLNERNLDTLKNVVMPKQGRRLEILKKVRSDLLMTEIVTFKTWV